MKRKTQKQKVKEYLLEGNTLTPVEAYERGWGMRLASIINILRGEGMSIGTNMIRNRYGTKYGQYYIKKTVDKQKKSSSEVFETLVANNSDSPINDDESKAKLLLRMKKYDRVQFRTCLLYTSDAADE